MLSAWLSWEDYQLDTWLHEVKAKGEAERRRPSHG
jgi:hypothetical protein